MSLLESLLSWAQEYGDDIDIKNELVELLERVGVINPIWLLFNQNGLHLHEHSLSLADEIQSELHEPGFLPQLLQFAEQDSPVGDDLSIGGRTFKILYFARYQVSNHHSIIVGQTQQITASVSEILLLTELGVEFLKKNRKINTLENSLRLPLSGVSPVIHKSNRPLIDLLTGLLTP